MRKLCTQFLILAAAFVASCSDSIVSTQEKPQVDSVLLPATSVSILGPKEGIPDYNYTFSPSLATSSLTHPSYVWRFEDTTITLTSAVPVSRSFHTIGSHAMSLSVVEPPSHDAAALARDTILINPLAQTSLAELQGFTRAVVAFTGEHYYVGQWAPYQLCTPPSTAITFSYQNLKWTGTGCLATYTHDYTTHDNSNPQFPTNTSVIDETVFSVGLSPDGSVLDTAHASAFYSSQTTTEGSGTFRNTGGNCSSMANLQSLNILYSTADSVEFGIRGVSTRIYVNCQFSTEGYSKAGGATFDQFQTYDHTNWSSTTVTPSITVTFYK